MPDSSPNENEFLKQVSAIVEENITNEEFGVTELADKMNMSRSNLLRKVKKHTNLSVSQLIRDVRLKRGMDLLRTSTMNVSEVSHLVGFSSTSYFIKCFREYYGYPPGEVGKREETPASPDRVEQTQPLKGKRLAISVPALLGIVGALAVTAVIYFAWPQSTKAHVEKSIAVLPFKNDSNDSSNIYLINGLMESTLNNLQKMKDVRVISRTTSEKYRNTARSIPEMAKELNVNYFVEGSGQKVGDHILLNIQLIEGSTDKHLWAKQYRREVKDIFELQQEIARNIASEIQIILTPEDEKKIDKIPTEDVVAYDSFLKAKDLFYRSGPGDLLKSVPLFKEAITRDPDFALAHANLALVYYYLDLFKLNRQYTDAIGSHSDKAMLLDPKAEESLVAKAVYYVHRKEYELAGPYFERALEYNPNSAFVFHFLVELYNIHTPNAPKYLEYALRKSKIDLPVADSAAASFDYLQLGNAFLQNGFFDEALASIDKCLAFNPRNYFGYIKPFILFAKDRDANRTKNFLLKELSKDTTRADITNEVGKMYYFMKQYDSAYYYYKRFVRLRELYQIDVFKFENLRLAMVYDRMGEKAKADEFAKSFFDYASHDRTIYKNMSLAEYYSYKGDMKKSMEYLKLSLNETGYQYWVLLLEDEPAAERMKAQPEFNGMMKELKRKFHKQQADLREKLKEDGLMN